MTLACPDWLGRALPELVRDHLDPMAPARAAKFADALAPCVREGHVIEVHRNGAVDAIAGIEPLSWDTGHFGVSCARLAPLCVSPELSAHTRFAAVTEIVDAAISWCRGNAVKLLLRRMVGARAEEARIFEERGFRLVDSILTLTASATEVSPDASVRAAVPSDRDMLRTIAWHAFPHSRFLADPGFDREKAHMVYVHWLDGLLTGVSNGEKPVTDSSVLVAELKGRPVGFLAIRRDRPADAFFARPLAPIELFAVSSAARGRGIGGRLLAAARDWALQRGAELVEASTWTAATAARRTYRRAGFSPADTILTFHGWIA